ncbi:MAG: hypothetical protein L6R42_002660 [Xanthoria sp. 1 TBL-2021]|nr:MAG: hypothetical protein L6R42_002660 [Xanthoria sp. 1 TBL-2021]
MSWNMDGIQGLNARYPGFSPKPAAGYLPGIAPFDYSGWFDQGHNGNSQNTESKEMIVLRSKLALAESRVEELRKDKAEAKNVIDYLLKLNAGAGFHKESPYTPVPCVVPQYTHNSRSAGDVNDILNPIIALLHDIVRAGPLDRNPRTQSAPRPSLGSGNLLDLLDEGPRSEDEAKGVENSSKPSSTLLECPKVTKPAGASLAKIAKDYVEQTDVLETDLMIFETDTSFTAPLVTRFRNARTEPESYQESSVRSPYQVFTPFSNLISISKSLTILQPTAKVHNESLDHLQKCFDVSETGLSGSTQYDASQSGSASSVSPISSAHNSDDENDPNFGNEHSKHPVDSGPATSTIHGTFNADEDPGHTHGKDAEDTSTPQNIEAAAVSRAAMFMPKWPASSFAVSATEREAAVFIHQRNASNQELRFPNVFKYGIRFRPDPMETDLYRTIVVTRLPSKLTMSALLQQIRGAAVVDAKLLDTRSIDGHSTALITFAHEFEAKAVEHKAGKTPLKFSGKPAIVTLLPTPIWPMLGNLRTAIDDHQHTRCLEVHNFPRGVKPAELEYDLRVCRCMASNRIEAKTMRSDGVLELRFNSVKYAGHAYGTLTTYKRYQQCRVKRVADPCARPSDGSLDQIHAAIEPASPKDQKPGKEASNVEAVVGITRWKEYAYETYTGVPSLLQARIGTPDTSDDRTYRLSDADVNDAATTQRGRGFTTKQCVPKPEDTCNPQ